MFTSTHGEQGPLGHNWGCAAQLTNWVVLLTHIITICEFSAIDMWCYLTLSLALPHLQIFTFLMVAVLITILFPIMEATFWVLVGSGRERAHLHVYGDIHNWIVVKWGNFLMGKCTCIHQMAGTYIHSKC